MTYKLEFENIKYSWMDAIQEADISITQEDKDILKELVKQGHEVVAADMVEKEVQDLDTSKVTFKSCRTSLCNYINLIEMCIVLK